jgi:RNA polymerase sigma-70 factor (ECF subfamily)
MVDVPSIDELIRRVQAGDQDAAAVLVKRYEPAIRRAVRFRLADAGLAALLDSMDICQSVLGSFFLRAATGQYKLETPEQLLKLLTTMARNKLISHARKQHAQRRDIRRVSSGDDNEGRFVSAHQSPSKQVEVRDLLQEVQRRLSPDERRMLELRNEGHDWASIASELGGSAEARRRRLSRALDRVAEQLGLDDGL